MAINYSKRSNSQRPKYGVASAKADPSVVKAEAARNQKAMAFTKINFILLAIGMAVVVVGFLLMAGGSSTTDAYNPDIFSDRRIKVAPLVCLFGFVFMIVAIIFRKKETATKGTAESAE